MTKDDDKRADESRRILDRLQKESDPTGSLAGRTARKVRNHLSAVDADQNDDIELWGTRIGRVLGLIVGAILLASLLLFLIGGQS